MQIEMPANSVWDIPSIGQQKRVWLAAGTRESPTRAGSDAHMSALTSRKASVKSGMPASKCSGI